MLKSTEPINPLLNPHAVQIGQVWEDLDKRMNGRRVVVNYLKGDSAYVRTLDGVGLPTGRRTVISLHRFNGKGTGFRRVE